MKTVKDILLDAIQTEKACISILIPTAVVKKTQGRYVVRSVSSIINNLAANPLVVNNNPCLIYNLKNFCNQDSGKRRPKIGFAQTL